ncbi:aryl-alcohol dehydrogenase-like predicted oxidoreductase [Actinophytocola algeriensis]|uniref:Aryl-alcohol dehydrogenase-like predicted oxidoreductase n=1 Tax=Actinophytocola algeriensis TaxID=1768010 RepID=A0A7W7QEW9_9PSEU|nr:aryl-alcohol dehydrogenase-like predicted oxidoreductase [Actinophytocola algeriensis]MBE1477647.1 aryl-alcohol dehydrogenase-like predicted oxidoreductase [Actinophytocola algeriensis]
MSTWLLGDRRVNRLGFGAMRLPQTGAAFEPGSPPRDRDQSIAVLRTAVELGVNHIDTAAFYFSALRSANELINSALSPYPDDLVIATKVGPSREPSGEWRSPAGPGELRGQVEENLRQLGRDHLDLVYLRAEGPGDITDRFAALAELRQAGLIRHLGISAVGPRQLAQARAVAPVVAVQNSYGLGYRAQQDEFIRLCGEQNVAFVPFFSIAGANREAGGGTDAAVRLAWTLARGPHVLVIPGTGDPGHLAENVAAAELRLSDEELARLDELHRTGSA